MTGRDLPEVPWRDLVPAAGCSDCLIGECRCEEEPEQPAP